MYSMALADILVNNTQVTAIVLAIIISIFVEFLVGWRLRFGLFGAILASLVGIWMFVFLLKVSITNDPQIYNIPILSALIGGVLFVSFWQLLTYRFWRGSERNHSFRRSPRRRYREE